MSQSRDEENRNRFADLPHEVTCAILGYIDIQDLARVKTLSRDFYKMHRMVQRFNVDLRHRTFSLPSSASTKFDGLRVLNLSDGRVAKQGSVNFGEWLSEWFPNLQELRLVGICGVQNLSIVLPSLQKLYISGYDEFQNINVESESLKTLSIGAFRSPVYPSKSVRIIAPNLLSLELEGVDAENYCMDKFKFLQSAGLYFRTRPCYRFQNSSKDQKQLGRNAHKLLQCVSEAKTLHVAEKLLQFLDDRDQLEFGAVQELFVHAESVNPQTMVSYLGRFPNLKFLSTRSYSRIISSDNLTRVEEEEACGYSKDHWEILGQLGFIHQLKTLHIEFQKGDTMKLGSFIKYLAKNASALDKITIYYRPPEFPQPLEIAREFMGYEHHSTRLLNLKPTFYRSFN